MYRQLVLLNKGDEADDERSWVVGIFDEAAIADALETGSRRQNINKKGQELEKKKEGTWDKRSFKTKVNTKQDLKFR
ncbi:hypothetical protein AgCh_004533 [Apium graveolens]